MWKLLILVPLAVFCQDAPSATDGDEQMVRIMDKIYTMRGVYKVHDQGHLERVFLHDKFLHFMADNVSYSVQHGIASVKMVSPPPQTQYSLRLGPYYDVSEISHGKLQSNYTVKLQTENIIAGWLVNGTFFIVDKEEDGRGVLYAIDSQDMVIHGGSILSQGIRTFGDVIDVAVNPTKSKIFVAARDKGAQWLWELEVSGETEAVGVCLDAADVLVMNVRNSIKDLKKLLENNIVDKPFTMDPLKEKEVDNIKARINSLTAAIHLTKKIFDEKKKNLMTKIINSGQVTVNNRRRRNTDEAVICADKDLLEKREAKVDKFFEDISSTINDLQTNMCDLIECVKGEFDQW